MREMSACMLEDEKAVGEYTSDIASAHQQLLQDLNHYIDDNFEAFICPESYSCSDARLQRPSHKMHATTQAQQVHDVMNAN